MKTVYKSKIASNIEVRYTDEPIEDNHSYGLFLNGVLFDEYQTREDAIAEIGKAISLGLTDDDFIEHNIVKRERMPL